MITAEIIWTETSADDARNTSRHCQISLPLSCNVRLNKGDLRGFIQTKKKTKKIFLLITNTMHSIWQQNLFSVSDPSSYEEPWAAVGQHPGTTSTFLSAHLLEGTEWILTWCMFLIVGGKPRRGNPQNSKRKPVPAGTEHRLFMWCNNFDHAATVAPNVVCLSRFAGEGL